MDKSHEKAKITRERNKACQEARRAAFKAEKEKDRPLVIEALRAILTDDSRAAPFCRDRTGRYAGVSLHPLQAEIQQQQAHDYGGAGTRRGR